MFDFEVLGALLGSGAADADLLRLVLRLSDQDGMEDCDTRARTEPILQTQGIMESENCHMCKRKETILQDLKTKIHHLSCASIICKRTELILRT